MNDVFPAELEPVAQQLYKNIFGRSYGDRTNLIRDEHYFYMEEHMSDIRKTLQSAYELGIDACVPRMYSEEQERQLNDMNINDHIHPLDEDIDNE